MTIRVTTGQNTFIKKIVVGTPISTAVTGLSIDQFNDFKVSTKSDAQILVYDSSEQAFKNFDLNVDNGLEKLYTPGNDRLLIRIDSSSSPIISGLTSHGSLLPGADSAYNLGDSDKKWKDLFLSGTTIHLGGLLLKDSGDKFGVKDSAGSVVNIDLAGSVPQIRGFFSAGGDLSYNSSTGVFSFDVEQVYTKANFDSDFNLAIDEAALGGVGLAYDAATNTIKIDSAEFTANFSTTNLPEGTNQYYTTARADSDAKASLFARSIGGGDGNFTYDSSSGVMTYTGPSASETRAHFTGDKGLVYSNSTGIFSVDSANLKSMISVTDAGGDGALAYNAANGVITYTGPSPTQVRAHFSGQGDITYDSATGVFSIDVEQIYTKSNFDSDLGLANTAQLPEGTNLYYTTARTDSDAKASLLGIDAGGDGSFTYDSATGVMTYTGPSASEVRAHITAGEGIDISSGAISGEDATVSNKGIASFNTEHFAVSSGAVSVKANGIDDTHIDFGTGTNQVSTADLPEQTNLYYTTVRADSDFDKNLDSASTDKLSEGSTNLYYTTARGDSDAKASLLGGTGVTYDSGSGVISIGQSVGTGDTVTFNEIRGPANFVIDPAAVGNATGRVTILGNLTVEGVQTVINSTAVSINDKNIILADSADSATAANGAGITINGANASITYAAVGDKFVFNKPFQGSFLGFDSDFDSALGTKNTANLTEGTNLYYTKARVDSDFDMNLDSASTTKLSEGTNLYYTKARVDSDVSNGNAARAGTVFVDESEDDNAAYNIIFENTRPAGNSYSQMQVDNGGLTFNPSTNLLTVAGTLRASATGNGGNLILERSDGTIVDGNTLGTISFKGTNEASGGDANVEAAAIVAEADTTFSSTANNTDLVFKLSTSGAAAEKARITHEGNMFLTGIMQANAFTGSGANLTALPAAQLTGTIDSARIPALLIADIGNIPSIDHDALANFVANEHISHSGVSIVAGKGLTGGGTIVTSRTFDIDSANVRGMFNFDSDYILAKDSANTAVERNKHTAAVKNFAVTVATKSTDHVYNGSGSSLGYKVDGTFSPIIQLQLGRTYRFTLSSSDMSSHPFRLYYDAAKTTAYTSGVTTTSTYLQIAVSEATPPTLHYQCSAHGYMGHALVLGTRNLTGFTTANLTEGSNLYFTNARAQGAISAGEGIDISSGAISGENASTSNKGIASFSADHFSVSSGAVTIKANGIDDTHIDFGTGTNQVSTADLPEQTNLYYTAARTTALIDSAYVQARTAAGTDSAATQSMIDSNFANTITFANDIIFDSAGGIIFDKSDKALEFGDDHKASFGTGGDLVIRHNKANNTSYIEEAGAGDLVIKADDLYIQNAAGTENMAIFQENGYVQLRHNHSVRFQTSDSGVSITGELTADSATIGGLRFPKADGSNNHVLKTDGSGNLSFASVTALSGNIDSSAVIVLVDSAYVQARTAAGTDSAATQAMIDSSIGFQVDSSYVQARQVGSAITIQEEASSLSTAASTLNFVGSGVTATGSGATKTITIPGSASGSIGSINNVKADTFAGNGSNKAFTLSNTPVDSDDVLVFINGILQHTNTYGVSGVTLTLDSAPSSSDEIETRTHLIQSVNLILRDHKSYIYTLGATSDSVSGNDSAGVSLAYDVGKVDVFANGVRLVTGKDFTAANGTSIVFDSALSSGNIIEVVSHAKATTTDLNGIFSIDSDLTSTDSAQIIHSFNKTIYRTVKYTAQLENNDSSGYHSEEILLVHNGTSVAMTSYAKILLDSDLGTFDARISGDNVQLTLSPTKINTHVKLRAIRTPV